MERHKHRDETFHLGDPVLLTGDLFPTPIPTTITKMNKLTCKIGTGHERWLFSLSHGYERRLGGRQCRIVPMENK